MLELLDKAIDEKRDVVEVELKGYFIVSSYEDEFTDNTSRILYKLRHNKISILVDCEERELTISVNSKSDTLRCKELNFYQQNDKLFVIEAEGNKNKYRVIVRGDVG